MSSSSVNVGSHFVLFLVVNCLILIVLVCTRANRTIKLMDGLSPRIVEFLSIDQTRSLTNDASFIGTLGLASSLTFWISVLYSLIMIMSALARYVYHSKNCNMTIKGQIVYGIYIFSHLVARATVSIAMLSTSESVNNEEPTFSVMTSAILIFVFCVIQFFVIYAFKYFTIKEFREIHIEEQLVHVLANTLVVIPFSTWDERKPDPTLPVNPDNIREAMKDTKRRIINRTSSEINLRDLNKTKSSFKKGHKRTRSAAPSVSVQTSTFSPTHISKTNSQEQMSLVALPDFADIVIGRQLRLDVLQIMKKDKNFQLNKENVMEKMKENNKEHLVENHEDVHKVVDHIHKEEVIDELKKKVLEMWWSNPAHDLTVDEIREKMIDSGDGHLVGHESDLVKVFTVLKDGGYINKELFHPRRTKTEYFWLLMINVFLNLFAMIVEVVNGGLVSSSGNYYSYDVRLSSFGIGLIFLGLYYKRYHTMKILTRFRFWSCGLHYCPVFCCIKADEPMKANPDITEMEILLADEEKSDNPTKHVGIDTQTSLLEVTQEFKRDSKRFDNDSILQSLIEDETDGRSIKSPVKRSFPSSRASIADSISRKSTESNDLAHTMLNVGRNLIKEGKTDEAIAHFNTCLQIFQQNPNPKPYRNSIYETHSSLGNCYLKKENFENALIHYTAALKIKFEIEGKKSFHPDVSQFVKGKALCYENLGQYEKAEKHYKNALEMDYAYYGKDKKHEAIAADFINLGSVAKKTGDYQDALNLANKALEMRNDLEVVDKRKIAETIWFQGLVFENKKNYSTAYEKLESALECAQEAPNNEEILPKIQKDLERLKRATPIKNNYMLDL